jgi:hypothetical protein
MAIGSGMVQSEAHAYEAFVGSNWEQEPEYLYAYAEFSNLRKWLNQRSLKIQMQEGVDGTTIRHEKPDAVSIDVPALDSTIEFQTTTRLEPGKSSASIEGRGLAKIHPTSAKPWSWYREKLRRLKLLLALLTDSEVTEKSVQGVRKELDREERIPAEKDHILRRPVLSKSIEEKHQARMLFTRDEAAEWLGDGVRRWFREWGAVEPLANHHLAVSYRDDMFADSQLLSLTQGLEGYHRNIEGEGYIPEEDWQSYREQLEDAISSELDRDHRDSHTATLKYGYTYSQRRRMKDLLRRLTEPERAYVCEDPEGFANEVVDARNTYVHRGGDNGGTPDLQKLGDYNYRLNNLSRILLLRFIGAPHDEIPEAMERTGRMTISD